MTGLVLVLAACIGTLWAISSPSPAKRNRGALPSGPRDAGRDPGVSPYLAGEAWREGHAEAEAEAAAWQMANDPGEAASAD